MKLNLIFSLRNNSHLCNFSISNYFLQKYFLFRSLFNYTTNTYFISNQTNNYRYFTYYYTRFTCLSSYVHQSSYLIILNVFERVVFFVASVNYDHLDDIGQPGSTNKGNEVVLARQFRALCYSTSKSGVSLCRSGLLFAKPMLTLQDFEYATS